MKEQNLMADVSKKQTNWSPKRKEETKTQGNRRKVTQVADKSKGGQDKSTDTLNKRKPATKGKQ